MKADLRDLQASDQKAALDQRQVESFDYKK